MRVPFDSVCLAAVAAELAEWVGARAQKVIQPDPHTVLIQLYLRGEAWLLLSCHPELARVYVCRQKPPRTPDLPPFCQELRKRIGDTRLVGAKQRGLDRVLDLTFSSAEGDVQLTAELMGKHSNLILMDERKKLLGAAKWVGPAKSRRPILPGGTYVPPPFEPRASILKATSNDDLESFEGGSPFFLKLLAASGTGFLAQAQDAIRNASYSAVISEGNGAYPLSVAALGLPERPVASISEGLEAHFSGLALRLELERLQASLLGQLKRVQLAREVAVSDLLQAQDAAMQAGKLQKQGDLILAYASSIVPGSDCFEAFDFDGLPITIPLNKDLSPIENAQRLFAKAKKAKHGSSHVQEQLMRLRTDLSELEVVRLRVERAETVDELNECKRQSEARRWLHVHHLPTKIKEERPYEGNSIRELLAPGGWRVLYGENATSNDYLTLRVAKPNDWWLHVRGAPSAHVIIQTSGRPDRVQKDAIVFAAAVAVRNSPSKHSSYVPVDYTLKKYVRRPKGGALGAALYTQEKTVHIESGT